MTTPEQPRILTLDGFRSAFTALDTLAWLDTPGCPPVPTVVTDALRGALHTWRQGAHDWVEWDENPHRARRDLAALLGVGAAEIALVSSVSEAAATVAGALPQGARVLVDPQEFRSNLLPWTAAARRGALDIVTPQQGGPETLTERLCAALVDGVDVVALSTVLSSTGARPDLLVIADQARAVGAKVFLDATQSFGVLDLDLRTVRPDFVAVHGYKWMLAPRGCAWLYVRSKHLPSLEPRAPGWHSVEEPNAAYFGDAPFAHGARKLDGALPWLPWIGGRAAIDLLRHVDGAAVETRALALAGATRRGLEALGIEVAAADRPSHIVRMYADGGDDLARHLRGRGVVASGSPTGLRVGFHGFNDDNDVARFLDGVETWHHGKAAVR